MSYSVGQVSRFAGVTVRTLHHYDEIGLLRPSGRTESGYRQYDEGDLERLQEVLFFRELGFGLEEIAGWSRFPPSTGSRSWGGNDNSYKNRLNGSNRWRRPLRPLCKRLRKGGR